MGPYEVDTIFDNGAIKITLDENHISFIVNGHRVILYHKPQSKEEFVHDILQYSEMEVVNREPSPSSYPT